MRQSKFSKVLTLVVCMMVCFGTMAFAKPKQEKLVEAAEEVITPVVPKNNVYVFIVDISQSIKNQLDDIIDGLCSKIVDNEERLKSGDYCVIVPLGDSSNAAKADAFGVQFSSDREKIKNYLHEIKNLMPTNLNTDIGAAMKKAFEYVNMINKENDGKMNMPRVFLITDGEIFGSKNCKDKLMYETPEAIFEDSVMNPDTNLGAYDDWWFLAIENEGVPLEHIKKIADRVGAISTDPEKNRFEVLTDMDKFAALFSKWIENIPVETVTPDNGVIKFSDVRLGGKSLSESTGSYTVISNASSKFTWTLSSTYERRTVVMQFKSVKATFQNDETGKTTSFELIPEAGNLEFTPKAKRISSLNVKFPSEVKGKGKLKLDIYADLNNDNMSNSQQIPEYLFYVNFKTPAALLMEKVIPIIAIILLIILIIIIAKIVKVTAPIKVKVEIQGKSSASKNAKKVSLKIKGKKSFGSNPSDDFKLDPSVFDSKIGTLERTGRDTFKINQLKSSAFSDENGDLSKYKLGTWIKINLKDGSVCSIKFSKIR